MMGIFTLFTELFCYDWTFLVERLCRFMLPYVIYCWNKASVWWGGIIDGTLMKIWWEKNFNLHPANLQTIDRFYFTLQTFAINPSKSFFNVYIFDCTSFFYHSKHTWHQGRGREYTPPSISNSRYAMNLKFVPGIPLVKWWQLVTLLTGSRGWCVIYSLHPPLLL